MPTRFLKRIQSAIVNQYDPHRDERIKRLAAKFYNEMKRQGRKFRLEASVAGLDLSRSDIEQAKELTLRHILDNIWKDGVFSQSEKEALSWIEPCLEISDEDALRLREEYAVEHFRASLANAMDDGVLSDEEYARLENIASSVGKSARAFARKFFLEEGWSFLQAMFVAAVEDGVLTKGEWERLISTSKRFGISPEELGQLIQSPAKQFVEHVLADAKADGELAAEERDHIEGLLRRLKLDDRFCRYVRQEMDEFEQRAEIAKGRLPVEKAPPGIELRAGELVHAYTPATLVIVRHLKSGTREDVHGGQLILLDNRAIFDSRTKSLSMNYRRIIKVRAWSDAVELQLSNKPAWLFHLEQAPPLFGEILRKAVALANQTAVRQTADEAPSRHIPRDVRQRVWQRYGGRCVECGAGDYLEFDHIIPFAKGGSSSDANIQLLCRKCNLAKSDAI